MARKKAESTTEDVTRIDQNMRFWDALGKTDPKHTKQFLRSGGFKGTAVKPMESYRRMTEYFGPCGVGWGPGEPHFYTHNAGDEVMVYCHVPLWYIDPADETKARRGVFGVGGDKILIKSEKKDRAGKVERIEYRADDEAYKKAFTDALTNAMKLIGVAADVHMGRFDDSKYVAEMQQEFSEMPKTHSEDVPEYTEPEPAPAKLITKAERDEFISLVQEYKRAGEVKEVLKSFGFESSGEITKNHYVALMYWAETGRTGKNVEPRTA